mmetsp:Transcript_59309/g.170342  ORF Transcript_59309/g.170342 Transcript_59309/m.170342 type:complete len:234 (+) Transcript_59309:601-1302(+)
MHHEHLHSTDHEEVDEALLHGGLQVLLHSREIHRSSDGNGCSQTTPLSLHAQVPQQHPGAHREAHAEEQRTGMLGLDVVQHLVEVLPRICGAHPRGLELQPTGPTVIQGHSLEASALKMLHRVLNEACAAVVVQAGKHQHDPLLRVIQRRLPPMQGHNASILECQLLHLTHTRRGKHRPQAAPKGGCVAAELEHWMWPVVAQQQLHLLQQVAILHVVPVLHGRVQQQRLLQLL